MTSFAHVLAEQWTMSSKKVKTEMFAGLFTLKVSRMEPPVPRRILRSSLQKDLKT